MTQFGEKKFATIIDYEEQSRQECDLRVFGCTTVKWNRCRIRQFQDLTSFVVIEKVRLLINWNKWRVRYINTKLGTVFDNTLTNSYKVRTIKDRMNEYQTNKFITQNSTSSERL